MKSYCQVYIGSYTTRLAENLGGEGEGIYRARMNLSNGRLFQDDSIMMKNPSFLALGYDSGVLYAVCEDRKEAKPDVTAIRVLSDGEHVIVSRQLIPGDYACHLAVCGNWLIVALYGSGSLLVYPLYDNGSIGAVSQRLNHVGSSVNPLRQESPHPHQIYFVEGKSVLLVPDLGIDTLRAYKVSRGGLVPQPRLDVRMPAGSGPRHLISIDNGDQLLVVGELSGCIYRFVWRGEHYAFLSQLALEPSINIEDHGLSTIKKHPHLRVCYSASRSHNSVYVVALDDDQMILLDKVNCDGVNPRDLSVSPDGKWLVVGLLDSNEVHTYSITEVGSLITPPVVSDFISPACVVFP